MLLQLWREQHPRGHEQTRTRKSKLYFGFRESGHAVRTDFLLDYLSDIELRRLNPAAANKSERFNRASSAAQ